MTVVAIPNDRSGPGRPARAMQELLGWAERIDFSDPRRRVLRELSLERREILHTLRRLRRLPCDRRTPVERNVLLREQRLNLYKIRSAMLALRATFRQSQRLHG